jgi:TolB-like protein
MSARNPLFALALLFMILSPALLAAAPYDDLVADLKASFSAGQTVAVAELESDSGSRTGRFIADEITEAFIRAGIAVVERRNVDRIAEELEFQLSGAVREETAAEIGLALGADYLLFGTVREIVRPEYANKGLKILAQLVDVEEGRVVGSASVEVEKSDMVSPYRRREVRKPVEYPGFFNLRLGAALLSTKFRDADAEEPEEIRGYGLEAGFGYIREHSGFFSGGWEFLYAFERGEDNGLDIRTHSFRLGKPFLLRIPVWRYFESLQFLTHAYFGIAGSAGLSFGSGDVDDYFGLNLKGEGLAGWSQSVSEAVSIFAEYRYSPRFANIGFSGFGAQSPGSLGVYTRREHTVQLGLSLKP